VRYLTPRGWIILIIAPALALIYYVSIHVHWTGDRYCWGTFTQCYTVDTDKREGEGKK
jgi:hypothetical protein